MVEACIYLSRVHYSSFQDIAAVNEGIEKKGLWDTPCMHKNEGNRLSTYVEIMNRRIELIIIRVNAVRRVI